MKETKDLDYCLRQIERLLIDFNCEIVVDRELGGDCILVDKDTKDFVHLSNINEVKEIVKNFIEEL